MMGLLFQKKHGQMSESLLTAAFIILSGGLQDAYTYLCRGKVFANAQTGNIVLFSAYLFEGDFSHCSRYLIPVLSFMLGIFIAECIHRHFKYMERVHWRQLILLIEIGLLFAAGLLPAAVDHLSSALVSLSCAMQIDSFRTVEHKPYASTMCIGNLRCAADALSAYWGTGEREHLRRSVLYFFFIIVFAVGAVLGGLAARAAGDRAVWFSCLLLFAALFLMFRKEQAA